MVDKDLKKIRDRVRQISENPTLREEVQINLARRDATSGVPPAELSGAYFKEYKKIRKDIQKGKGTR